MRPAVVVTGISGNLGRALAKQLHTSERIIGIDRRPFVGRPKDVEMYQLDLRKKKAEDVFRKNEVGAVIHMGIMHDPRMSQDSSAEAWNRSRADPPRANPRNRCTCHLEASVRRNCALL